jgi:hypothetical protein
VNILPIHILPRSPSVTARIYPFSFGNDLDEDEEKPQKNEQAKSVYKAASTLNLGYSNVSQQYAIFLTTLKRPVGIDSKKYRRFKSEALKYIV